MLRKAFTIILFLISGLAAHQHYQKDDFRKDSIEAAKSRHEVPTESKELDIQFPGSAVGNLPQSEERAIPLSSLFPSLKAVPAGNLNLLGPKNDTKKRSEISFKRDGCPENCPCKKHNHKHCGNPDCNCHEGTDYHESTDQPENDTGTLTKCDEFENDEKLGEKDKIDEKIAKIEVEEVSEDSKKDFHNKGKAFAKDWKDQRRIAHKKRGYRPTGRSKYYKYYSDESDESSCECHGRRRYLNDDYDDISRDYPRRYVRKPRHSGYSSARPSRRRRYY